MSQPHHPLVEAATFLDRTIRLFLTEADALHAETWILAVSRMAGTQLQKAVLSGGRPSEGVGEGWRFWGRRPRRDQASGDAEGRRLVALLLASLAQLGEPLAEEAIDCPPEGSACGRLSLEQTRARLGALVDACGRSHGLGAADMAEALTIATALALHQCRDLVPLTQGAGLAVMGLVEGARSAEPLAAAA
jgi:hypothetical protein